MSKKILVTGGAGFIGSHLVDYLIAQGHHVTVLDDLSGGLIQNVNPKATFVRGSINDVSLVEKVMKGQEIVYHLAAYAAEGLSHFIRRYNYMNNLIGSVNLINEAIKNNVRSFVFTSSMAVYGSGNPPFDEKDKPSPEDPYGVAKHAVEIDLKTAHDLFGLNYVIIRPHNVYGERQYLGDPYRNVIGIFMNRIMQGKSPLIYGDGTQTRAFSYIGDVVPCLARAAFTPAAQNQVINLGSSRVYSIKELCTEVLASFDTDIAPIHVAARHEVKHAHCTTAKSEKILGYEDKTSLRDGLKAMTSWAKSVGPMTPIVWEQYEITHKLPDFWVNLKKDFPTSSMRINPLIFSENR